MISKHCDFAMITFFTRAPTRFPRKLDEHLVLFSPTFEDVMAESGVAEKDLTYALSEKGPLLIISFQGPFTKDQEKPLAKCQEEIAGKGTKFTILNLRDVSAID